jgi:hypothetical protein
MTKGSRYAVARGENPRPSRQELAQSTTHSMAETGNESVASCYERIEMVGCGGGILSVFNTPLRIALK